MANDELKKLHTAIIDAEHGYDEAAKDAETPALAEFFGQMSQLHQSHHDEIHRLLVSLGEKPDDDGSFMTSIHKGVISVRAAITGLQSAIASFASGEEKLLERYNDAMESTEPTAGPILRRQKAALQAKIVEMKAMPHEHA